MPSDPDFRNLTEHCSTHNLYVELRDASPMQKAQAFLTDAQKESLKALSAKTQSRGVAVVQPVEPHITFQVRHRLREAPCRIVVDEPCRVKIRLTTREIAHLELGRRRVFRRAPDVGAGDGDFFDRFFRVRDRCEQHGAR